MRPVSSTLFKQVEPSPPMTMEKKQGFYKVKSSGLGLGDLLDTQNVAEVVSGNAEAGTEAV